MAESIIQVTSAGATKLHTFNRTIGANSVEDEIVLLGDQYLATYYMATGSGISAATAAAHLIQIMAGATLRVQLRRLILYQVGLATAASTTDIQLLRLTTAGTGGTATTPSLFDPADAASGATGMSLPTVKGTEGTGIWRGQVYFHQTLPTFAAGVEPMKLLDLAFDSLPHMKPPIIAAGAANGLALKIVTGIAAATVAVVAYYTEANF